jgi:cell division protein FtsB
VSDARPGPPATPPGPPRPSGRGSSITGRALILAIVAVTLFLSLTVPVRQWFAQRAEIAQLRADVDAARDRVAALQLEKLRWDDPAFVAAEARRRLHFVLPGEVGYVALGTDKTEEELAAEAAGEQPWYSTLWGAVQAADGATGATDIAGNGTGKNGATKDGPAKHTAGKGDPATKDAATKEPEATDAVTEDAGSEPVLIGEGPANADDTQPASD